MKLLLRYYSIAVFFSVVAVLGVLALLYRATAVSAIVAVAQNYHLALAQGALNPIRMALADYLIATAAEAGAETASVPLPDALNEAIGELMRDSGVRRIKIYNQKGVVSASTKSSQIGAIQADNPGFLSAMNGQVLANVVYRGAFNRFDRAFEDSNMIESYIPVRRRPTEPVLGVLEIYTDANTLIGQAERMQLAIMGVSLAVVAALCASLIIIVRKARNLIEAQEKAIRDKSVILERLSQRSLRREERERKRLAVDLHEGLAQTLSVIKIAVENAQLTPAAPSRIAELLQPVVPILQNAIGQVRAIARDLRPSGIDDLGLAPTIIALCREFERLRPGVRVEPSISLSGAVISAALQIVVYRNVDAGLKFLAQRGATEIAIGARAENGTLTLSMEAGRVAGIPPGGLSDLAADTLSPLSAVRDRTIISGGELSLSDNERDGITLRAAWRI